MANFIEKSQKRNLLLEDSLDLITRISKNLSKGKSKASKAIKQRWSEIIDSNDGLKVLHEVHKWRRGEVQNLNGIDDVYVPDLSYDEILYLDFCPLTSTDVERAFSRYGNVFTDLRRCAKIPSLKSQLIIQWNYNG